MNNIEKWLSEYINTPYFQAKLEGDIDMLDKPADRVRVRLELMSYIIPKVKTVDPASASNDKTIEVHFVEDGGK